MLLGVVGCGTPSTTGGRDDAGATVDVAVASDTGGLESGTIPALDAASTPAIFRHDALLIGNSFISVNDVPGLYRRFVGGLGGAARVESVAPGGYTLAQHAADVWTDGQPLARWLRTGTPDERAFDVVILQEQSQTGGFHEETAPRRASVDAARQLARLAVSDGATVVLELTWGYRRGDPANAALYGSYLAMQDRLDVGILALAEDLSTHFPGVRVAPAGGAFRLVYEDVLRAGGDPLASGSDFEALYEPDGVHPSLRGAYLAACVLAGTATGADPGAFVDEPSLGAATSRSLRDVCGRALRDPRWRLARIRTSDAVIKPSVLQNGARFGAPFAMRADGNEVLAHASTGITRENQNVGVYTQSGNTWLATSFELARGVDGLAWALCGEGTRLIVGLRDDHLQVPGGYAGSARVYLRSGGSLVEEPLPRTVFQPSQRFGYAVALNADGTRALVSALGEASNRGVVRVYARHFDGWVEEGRLEPDGMLASGQYWGVSLALSGDGLHAVIGSLANGANAGRVGVFARVGGGWRPEVLLSPPAPGAEGFGTAVALSSDARTVLVGAPASGTAHVYTRTADAWTWFATLRPARTLVATLSLGEPPKNGAFGGAVALSADGRRALVGAPLEDRPGGRGAGSAFTFVREAGTFRQETLLLPRSPSYFAQFGTQVAITDDGRRAAISAPGERLFEDLQLPLSAGAVHLFDLP